MERLQIAITGIVQGVGFRPFVYKLAKKWQIDGWVLNDESGVTIEAEGSQATLQAFLNELRESAPSQAVITGIAVLAMPPAHYKGFEIKISKNTEGRKALISPDIATCPDCIREIKTSTDRRYAYPFTNCTNCGPRYSIVRDIPYDRENTTMTSFAMCPSCNSEYVDSNDRRFHAQPNACPVCGPRYELFTAQQEKLAGNPLAKARELIKSGAVLAVKGIGGYHLVCDAKNNEAVKKLRARKFREDKPFAVMCPDLLSIREECIVNEAEEALLTGTIRPIVLLAKKNIFSLAERLAPGNPYLGVMMPYAPVHWLLLEDGDWWVMTSGNVSDEPICYQDEEAFTRLRGIADYFLVHNRLIESRVDDSIVRVATGSFHMLRRARGYVPAPIAFLNTGPQVLAVGGELKNTFCLTKEKLAFLSPHIGDLENMETFSSYTGLIQHFKRMFAVSPEIIAYDMHPDYLATKYAMTLPGAKIAVQHHHAHIAAVLAEHGFKEQVIGVAFDGTGYGTDGNLWGGEFLVASVGHFTRLGHFRYVKLPGGAKAIREPWRQALSVLYEIYGDNCMDVGLPFLKNVPEGSSLLLEAVRKNINTPLSSGAGRLFDIAAVLLGIRSEIHYEGQAAIELELAAAGELGCLLPYGIRHGEVAEIDFFPAFQAMVNALLKKESPGKLAASFHLTVASATVDMIKLLSTLTGIRTIALSGGVFQNITLLGAIRQLLPADFRILMPKEIPANDGGLSFGQAAVARERST